MRAAVWRGPSAGHVIETVADPTPGPDEVVLRVERSGVCGSDVSMTTERETPTLLGPGFDAAFGDGAILGHELCGEVVAVGANVRGAAEEDRLAPMFFHGCGRCLTCLAGEPQLCESAGWFMGGYAEFALARPDCALKLPSTLSSESGALIEPLATSLKIVRAAEIAPGARVLILGAGALGIGAIGFARRLGAGQIVALARTSAKEHAARQAGADGFITSPDPVSPSEVAEAFGGLPDVVIETAGARGLVDVAITCIRPGGTIVIAGLCPDPERTAHAVASMKNLVIRYTTAYTKRDFEVVAEIMQREAFPPLELPVKPVGMSEFSAAFESLRLPGARRKVVLDPWTA